MKLKCTVGDILQTVNKVWETTDVKLAQVAANIYLKGVHKASESWLYVYATDYRLQCLTKIEVELDEDFELVLSPDNLVRGITNLNHEKELTLTKGETDTQLQLKCGTVKYKVPCGGEIGFHKKSMQALPALTKPDFTCHPSLMTTGVKSVLFAVSDNKNIYGVIRSVEIKGKDTTITFSGSDGRIAAVTELKCKQMDKEFKVCVNKDDVSTFLKLITLNPAGEMEIFPEGVFFKFPDTLLGIGKIVGSLPDIKAIIAKYEVATSAVVEKKPLLETAKRAALFAHVSVKELPIKISCGKEGLKFEVNDFEEDLAGEFGKSDSAKVDKDQLVNCISSCNSDKIEVCFAASVSQPDNKVLIIKESYKEEEVDLTSQYIIMGQ